MSYYVTVGRRGHLIRAGTFLLHLTGSLAYWWDGRRRPSTPMTWTFPEGHPRDFPASIIGADSPTWAILVIPQEAP